jgi:hypothetical protein
MIPEELRSKVEQQPGNIHRSNSEAVDQALEELGIAPGSEFGAFFREYVITFFRSDVSDEELCDLLEPTAEISAGTRFVREMWELPEQYVCLSNIQGEGAYLYDRNTGEVWDFYLAHREDFLAGKQKPISKGFFEFMSWYLNCSGELGVKS